MAMGWGSMPRIVLLLGEAREARAMVFSPEVLRTMSRGSLKARFFRESGEEFEVEALYCSRASRPEWLEGSVAGLLFLEVSL
ncbi:hypothetical protein BCR34DRAFT_563143 [Clohesyomyces aquaticus]|uniref:Uncharacterized protein n=1 Tax=Clohesyomyces aquaticus TaxID=1231657 RepID=A0A1Y1ZRG2_9PLEO|nr:hypothetical protein BCR34DRAFT_563143 [Clohesyomyces aquaticus]